MVPVRDGVRLNTSICEPRGAHPPLPILIARTPYGIAGDTVVAPDYRFLAADGYVIVTQDIRGRYGSEGQFFMNRPLHNPADAKGTDESTDTYDTVDWLHQERAEQQRPRRRARRVVSRVSWRRWPGSIRIRR